MRQPKVLQFSREVDAVRNRIRAQALDIQTRHQQGEETMKIGPYKVILRATSASMADSIRIELDQNKAMTFRLNNGQVRISSITAVGPRVLNEEARTWLPATKLLALFNTEEAKQAWRTNPPAPLSIGQLLQAMLKDAGINTRLAKAG